MRGEVDTNRLEAFSDGVFAASEEQIERTVKALEANGMAAMGSIRRNSLYTLRIGGELPLQRLGN